MFGPGGEAEFLQSCHGGRLCFLFGCTADQGGQHGVLEGVELGQQLVELKDEADVGVSETGEGLVAQRGEVGVFHDDRAAVGAVQRGENVEQCGLARAGRADDGDDLSSGQRYVHAPQDMEVAVAFVNAGRLEHVRKLRPKANFAAPKRPHSESAAQ